ncbi:RidA family protein [Herbiconiux moechotypicola]|uniref:RidA family protein n=1 Tax=Herbiconiux moechotypicola TaxID=637393 RepID=A0ABN3D9J2_9MICO|nr:RidA family protein [Herbiconiux moechotypicola]MCS5728158.1 RidA family protein [Herbiconiux moechotypicola]
MTEFVNPPTVFGLPGLISQLGVVGAGQSLLFVSGQVAWGDDGEFVGVGDHGAQVARIVERVDGLLAAVGATRSDIVKETIYVVGHSPELVPAILGPLRAGVEAPPTSTYLGVQSLYAPEALVEIDFVVALPA